MAINATRSPCSTTGGSGVCAGQPGGARPALMAYAIAEDPAREHAVHGQPRRLALTHTHESVGVPDQALADEFLVPYETERTGSTSIIR